MYTEICWIHLDTTKTSEKTNARYQYLQPIVRFASWQMQQWYSCKMPPPAPAPSHVQPDVYAQFSGHLINHCVWTCPTFGKTSQTKKSLLGGFYLHDENQEQNWKIYQPEWRDFTPLRIARGKPNVGFHANNK